MKLEFKKAKVIGNVEGSLRDFLAELGKGRYVKLMSHEHSIEDFIGKEVEALSSLCGTRVYGLRTQCGKILANHINHLPKEYQEKAKQMLYSN